MKYIKQFFKGWNVFEYVFLVLLWVAPVTLGIIFESSIIEIAATTLSLACALCLAKGKIEGYFIGLAANVFFAIVCFRAKLYGELIICLALYYPLMLYGIYSWLRSKHNDQARGRVVRVGCVRKKELCLVVFSQLVMGIGYYFLLKEFGTEYLAVSTFSVIVQVVATYLLARRSQFGPGPFVFGDIAQIVLWAMIVASGNTGAIAILVMPCLYLVNDSYGFFNWRRMKKEQANASAL